MRVSNAFDMHVPDDPPACCPTCGASYASVSRHRDGFMVNLIDNEQYRRVCFSPVSDGTETAAMDCYHHTHQQVTATETNGSR